MSTGTTTNLGLHQWVLDDAFLMEEVNEDNRKIDAALGSMAMEKLGSIVTTQECQQIDVDLSTIDWNKFHSVTLFFEFNKTAAGRSDSNYYELKMRVNNLTTGYYRTKQGDGMTSGAQSDICYGSASAYATSAIINLAAQNPVTDTQFVNFTANACNRTFTHLPVDSAADISTFNIISANTAHRFAIGSVVNIWGVRK